MADVPTQLRLRRESLGLTVRDLAPKIGVGFSALSKWETGRVDVPWSRLQEWAGELGVRLNVIATDSATPRIEEMDLSGEQLALMKSVLELLPMISDDEAAMLRGQMEGLAALRRKG